MPSKNVFTWGRPQMKTMMLRMIQGSQGAKLPRSRRGTEEEPDEDGRLSLSVAFSGSILSSSLCASVAELVSASNRQMRVGRQNFRNVPSAAIETNAATTSTNQGP